MVLIFVKPHPRKIPADDKQDDDRIKSAHGNPLDDIRPIRPDFHKVKSRRKLWKRKPNRIRADGATQNLAILQIEQANIPNFLR